MAQLMSVSFALKTALSATLLLALHVDLVTTSKTAPAYLTAHS
jgi:hypothetical protein